MALVGAALPAQAEGPLRVVYRVQTSAGSWQPLSPKDLGRAVEAMALEELSKSGRLRLERDRGSGSGQKPGAYRLTIRSHILDEAETHSVSLELSSGTDQGLPSLSASRTVQLGRLKRGKMLDRVERSARAAAKALAKSLKGPLARLGTPQATKDVDEPFDLKAKPWQWAKVSVPRRDSGRAAKELFGKNSKKRQAALRVLTSLARVESSPRNALERCALTHKDKRIRLGCLEGLKPLSRRKQPTARVVVEVYRKTKDRAIRREANAQMLYFAGPAKQAAVQAWLEAAAHGKDSGPLSELGDLPNLDTTIRRCLEATGKARRSDNKRAFSCIKLLEPLPYARRRAILWRFIREMKTHSPYYLKGAGEREGSTGTPWQRGVEAVLHESPAWDPKLEEILWARYQRTLSSSSMNILCSWGAPSKRLAGRLLEILQTKGENRALNGLVRMVRLQPDLRPMVTDKLNQMLEMGTFSKDVNERSLQQALKRIEKEAQR